MAACTSSSSTATRCAAATGSCRKARARPSPGPTRPELARAELREETGLKAAEMAYAGHLFLAYGYSAQGYHVFRATGLRPGPRDLDHEEQDLVTRAFNLDEVEAMLRDAVIKDATTVAALGLLRLKGML